MTATDFHTSATISKKANYCPVFRRLSYTLTLDHSISAGIAPLTCLCENARQGVKTLQRRALVEHDVFLNIICIHKS